MIIEIIDAKFYNRIRSNTVCTFCLSPGRADIGIDFAHSHNAQGQIGRWPAFAQESQLQGRPTSSEDKCMGFIVCVNAALVKLKSIEILLYLS